MRNRRTESIIWIALMLTVCLGTGLRAQDTKQVQAAGQASSSVSAELVKGKLSPSSSKPGDKVDLRLKDDFKSNGAVLLKKGTTITGVVRNVKQMDSKSKSAAQSMMEIEWLTPAASGAANQKLNIALQSVAYTNPLFAQQQNEESSFGGPGVAAPAPRVAQQSGGGASSRSGGLLGGIGGTTSSTTSTVSSVGGSSSSAIGGVGAAGTGVTGTVASSAGSTVNAAGAAGQSGTGRVTSLPPADAGIASAIQSNLGASGGQWFSTGHGEVISAGGTRDNVDLFSRLSNDTVITSPSKNFEVSSGAQMQLLVGVSGR